MKGELMKTYIAYFDETGDDGVTIFIRPFYFNKFVYACRELATKF